MKAFDELCREFEQLDAVSYTALLAEKSAKILPALRAVTGNGIDGTALFAAFVLGAVAADGKLSEEEYLLCYPLLHAFFGDDVNYDDCKDAAKHLRSESRAFKKSLDEIVDFLGLLSDDLKNEIVLVALMICAIDGKVSPKEKNWIKKLVR